VTGRIVSNLIAIGQFRNASPEVWNSLPHQLTDDLSCPASFHHNLKTHLLANLSVTDCRGQYATAIRQFSFDWHMLRHQLPNKINNKSNMSRLGSEYWLGSEILANDCCGSSFCGQLTTSLNNERIPIDRPIPIQTFFEDGSVIIKSKLWNGEN